METLCNLCPNACGIDRDNLFGGCGVKNSIKIAKFYLHPFEEPLISGKNGSGTVFFGGCSLRCAFCQNYELSHESRGKIFTVGELADIFKRLEEMGAHNINLVNPTHYSKQIVEALDIYRPDIPVVWNTHGYETLETLEFINDYVDVYLPDLKFFTPSRSKRYTEKENYFEFASKAIEFMLEKKSPVVCDGLMKQGVIVRHLILPQNVDESLKILDYLAPIMQDNYLSLMAQYTPLGDLEKLPELKRRITRREYSVVKEKALSLGIKNVFVQEYSSASEAFIPDWDY